MQRQRRPSLPSLPSLSAVSPRLRGLPVILLPLAAAGGCTQATMNRAAMDIIGQVVQAGIAIPTTTTTSSGRSGSASAPPPPAAPVLGTSERYIGVPYKWGGTQPSTGFDCSGFVKYVYARHGIALPRTSREQAHAGRAVALRQDALSAGDLMLFAEPGEAISHVAIYAGDGWFIHSSASGKGVRYTQLDPQATPWYVQNMVAARRVTSNGRSLVQSLALLSHAGWTELPNIAPAPK